MYSTVAGTILNVTIAWNIYLFETVEETKLFVTCLPTNIFNGIRICLNYLVLFFEGNSSYVTCVFHLMLWQLTVAILIILAQDKI